MTGHPSAGHQKGSPTGHICAVVNQKGGVGKTTTAVNLGASLACLGHRTLLVDLDPQGNATSGVGISKLLLEATTYDVIIGEVPASQAIKGTSLDGLEVIPANLRLAGAEIELAGQVARESRLREVIRPEICRYDVVLIDCPPSLGLLTINALTAADSCLIPLQCEFYALEGLSQLMDTLSLVRKRLNLDLRISGVVLTMTQARTRLSEQVAEEVRRFFPNLVFASEIPRSVRLAEAPSYGQPIIVYAPGSKATEAYMELAKEFLVRLGFSPGTSWPDGARSNSLVFNEAAKEGADQ